MKNLGVIIIIILFHLIGSTAWSKESPYICYSQNDTDILIKTQFKLQENNSDDIKIFYWTQADGGVDSSLKVLSVDLFSSNDKLKIFFNRDLTLSVLESDLKSGNFPLKFKLKGQIYTLICQKDQILE